MFETCQGNVLVVSLVLSLRVSEWLPKFRTQVSSRLPAAVQLICPAQSVLCYLAMAVVVKDELPNTRAVNINELCIILRCLD